MKKIYRIIGTPFYIVFIAITYVYIPIKILSIIIEFMLYLPSLAMEGRFDVLFNGLKVNIRQCADTNYWHF